MRTNSAKRRGWKDDRKRIKVKKTTKLALWALGFIILLLVLGQFVRLYRNLNSSWGEGASKSYSWNKDYVINLVLKGKDIALLSFNPKMEELTLINLPDNLLIEVPRGFGRWQIRSIYDLGESNKKGEGVLLLEQSVSSLFGLPIDGTIDFYKEGDKDIPVLVESFRKDINIFNILGRTRTNLTLFDLIKLKTSLSSVRFDKVKIVNLHDLFLLDKEKLADGTEVFSAELAKLDSAAANLSDPYFKDEYKGVAIFNATEKPMLATSVARVVTNMGGNVISVANSESKVSRTYLYGDTKSKTYQRLMQIFDKGCSKDKKCDKIPTENLGSSTSRADIVIVLGDDFL